MSAREILRVLTKGPQLDPLPPVPMSRDPSVPHRAKIQVHLTLEEKKLAVRNALRYFPKHLHAVLGPEFAKELEDWGHIYMYRFRPTEYKMQAYNINDYPARNIHAAAMQLMIMNNLSYEIAQFPHELVTYGGNGSVFSNWAQYHLVMMYLSMLTEEQTLVMYSGHPMGLFPSSPAAPRAVITNGMVIPNYSSKDQYEKMFATGVSMYGQMTAGSYCYIGPQGIVHGTTITVMNASRKYLGKSDMAGVVYLSSGLGGMSGAQPKAAVIAGAVGVIAEIDEAPLRKRYNQGWIQEIVTSVEELIPRIRKAKADKKPISIGYHGNVVTVLEKLAELDENIVELASDQTSLHNPYNGGYYPVQLSFEEAQVVMVKDPAQFKKLVQESLVRQTTAINKLTKKGMKFWDYGNSFLLEASRAGADIMAEAGSVGHGVGGFRYPSYVQDIMGDIFSLGFGPFRWICTSCDPEDLRKTDKIARDVLVSLKAGAPKVVNDQLDDNILWITHAEENKMVVGSQARILYADSAARSAIAVEFNRHIATGHISAPIVLSRDHHDVSGTDSPFRETSNITDGSCFTADMAVQNAIGDAARGASWVALHNGGGVGWGEVTNGGFGLVLTGTKDAEAKAKNMLFWDVNNGVCRRAWGANDNANVAIRRAMEVEPLLKITLPEKADEAMLDTLF